MGQFMAVAALAILCSCSVKEDRSGCPCYLTMNVDEFVREGLVSGVVSFKAAGLDTSESLDFADWFGTGYTVAVPRRELSASCVSGLSTCILEGNCIRIPAGLSSDPIHSYRTRFVPEGDEDLVMAVPHKQYCRLFLVTDDPAGQDSVVYRISGRMAGLDLFSLTPLPGHFECPVYPDGNGTFMCSLLRQDDDSGLVLEAFDAGDEVIDENDLKYSINLSSALLLAGYDWTAEDLEDVYLKVDYARAEVTVTIGDWDGGDSRHDVEI